MVSDINTLSKAIFYAINNSRDDIVKLLLKHDANLLINNRMGNTPCGMAAGRLALDTLDLLRQTEKQQLAEGRKILDYTKQVDGKGLEPRGAGMDGGIRTQSEKMFPPHTVDTAHMKKLSKKLRDSAGKRGKYEVVRSIIGEAGEAFPEVSEDSAKNSILLCTD
jgi:Ankyrin repeats (many copies)